MINREKPILTYTCDVHAAQQETPTPSNNDLEQLNSVRLMGMRSKNKGNSTGNQNVKIKQEAHKKGLKKRVKHLPEQELRNV